MKSLSLRPDPAEDSPFLLSNLVAGRHERRLAVAVVALSLLVFAALLPFVQTPLAQLWAFIPSYESWLVVIDLMTAVVLFGQFAHFDARALLVLGSGYLFTALMTVAHALTFPGLFAATGLLGAGPQSTAWLYMFWHGGFPLFVIAYTLRQRGGQATTARAAERPLATLALVLAGVAAAVAAITALATLGHDLLPAIMQGQRYTPAMIGVVSAVWILSLAALLMLWRQRRQSVLDLWLMVVMCAWMIDIALSAVLNHARFDLGFYAGRIYGLLAASFVLLVLLVESGMLYQKLLRLATRLRQLTTEDALTGIANRRAFDLALEREWQHALRSNLPLSLMMIDIDYFKIYNDSYGHVEGDKCLRAVATALHASVSRATDLAVRYGGEEFAVLLPQTDADHAGRIAENLRDAVARLEIPHPAASGRGRVTVSIGVACLQPTWTSAPAANDGEAMGSKGKLVELADQALYAAKTGGRDRVVVGHAPEAR